MKKLWKLLLLGGLILLTVLFFNTHFIKFPVNWAQNLVNMRVETNYIPIKYKNSYATIRNCGRNCSYIKVFYKGSKESLVITATNHVSWADDPRWNRNTIIPGTKYYYQKKGEKQLLFWREEKEGLELRLEYIGEEKLPKKELVQIADSVKAER
ncbi:hypothetical protein [Priestia abyssalis]|uniref:hypothetical protein n=1 Tax=Priestia abyssalis TaxID=1221450 RepID=UPI000994B963|nr:hypothetical protein [Priestia abyssalis]